MIGHHHVRVVTELEAALAFEMAVGLKIVDFFDQSEGVDHSAVTDQAELAGMQRSGRNKPQNELPSVVLLRVRTRGSR